MGANSHPTTQTPTSKKRVAREALEEAGFDNITDSKSGGRGLHGVIPSTDEILMANDLPEGWAITDVHHIEHGVVYVGVGPV